MFYHGQKTIDCDVSLLYSSQVYIDIYFDFHNCFSWRKSQVIPEETNVFLTANVTPVSAWFCLQATDHKQAGNILLTTVWRGTVSSRSPCIKKCK